MAYQLNWINNGFFVKWSGHATSKEIIDSLEELHLHPEFDRSQFSLHDYRDCESISYEPDEMDFVGALDEAGALINPREIVAVVGHQPVLTEIVENYARLNISSLEIDLHETLQDAIDWLAEKGISVKTGS